MSNELVIALIVALTTVLIATGGGGLGFYRFLKSQEDEKRAEESRRSAEYQDALRQREGATWERSKEQYKSLQGLYDALQIRVTRIEVDFASCKVQLEDCIERLRVEGEKPASD